MGIEPYIRNFGGLRLNQGGFNGILRLVRLKTRTKSVKNFGARASHAIAVTHDGHHPLEGPARPRTSQSRIVIIRSLDLARGSVSILTQRS